MKLLSVLGNCWSILKGQDERSVKVSLWKDCATDYTIQVKKWTELLIKKEIIFK